ncbi:hypothetical protein [Paenibacillus agilis]|uniref:DUF4190 domain-containing protein n=1 Tax=Paenibacillus agilis TaxID=3020863 RepID=A0A559J317_9BACL|nr:hypothetical protein [Paenibacillus agilis]TVX94280.1 hypothetical protein FPZ44_15210 [Paenibacillus agilis]
MSHKKHDRRLKRNRNRNHLQDQREYHIESAYELMGNEAQDFGTVNEKREVDVPSGLGYTAIGFAIASLFMFPYILGLTSIALGFMSIYQGSRSAGATAMIIGAAAILIHFLFLT